MPVSRGRHLAPQMKHKTLFLFGLLSDKMCQWGADPAFPADRISDRCDILARFQFSSSITHPYLSGQICLNVVNLKKRCMYAVYQLG